VFNHGNGKRSTVHASSAQLWRLNECGVLKVRSTPGDPLLREPMKELLAELAEAGAWQPQPRAGKS
jgi:molybdenum cofactor biosynthesis enzyme MoaA